jgi:hypothetical protein
MGFFKGRVTRRGNLTMIFLFTAQFCPRLHTKFVKSANMINIFFVNKKYRYHKTQNLISNPLKNLQENSLNFAICDTHMKFI